MVCTLYQAGNIDEVGPRQRDGSLRPTVCFLSGPRHNDSVAHVFKFSAVQAVLFYQLTEHFLYASSPLGPGNPEIK